MQALRKDMENCQYIIHSWCFYLYIKLWAFR